MDEAEPGSFIRNHEPTMSDSPLLHQRTIRRLRIPGWSAGIAVVVLLVFAGARVLISSVTSDPQKVSRHPAGQFQADARTLVAAFSYLFESEADSICPEAPTGAATLCASNVAVQPLTSASFCCTSNQAESFSELITNVPARS